MKESDLPINWDYCPTNDDLERISYLLKQDKIIAERNKFISNMTRKAIYVVSSFVLGASAGCFIYNNSNAKNPSYDNTNDSHPTYFDETIDNYYQDNEPEECPSEDRNTLKGCDPFLPGTRCA